MPKILVIEDHPLVRDGIAHTLGRHDPGAAILQAKDQREALSALQSVPDIDLALVDLMLPDTSGFSLLNQIRTHHPSVAILVLSAKDDSTSIKKALRNGASGFVSKTASTEELILAVTQILAGCDYESRIPIDSDSATTPPSSTPRNKEKTSLTPAQTRVFELLLTGRSNREIAETLLISEGTAKLHVSAIFRAYEVSSRAQLLATTARSPRKRT